MEHLARLNNRGARPVPALDCSGLKNGPFERHPIKCRPPRPISTPRLRDREPVLFTFGGGHETLLASSGRRSAARLRHAHGKSADAAGAGQAAAFMARYSARRLRLALSHPVSEAQLT